MVETQEIEIGSLVAPTDDENTLRSGCETYGRAVCLSVEPFILVSECGSMRWSRTVSKENFRSVGKASTDAFNAAILRLEK